MALLTNDKRRTWLLVTIMVLTGAGCMIFSKGDDSRKGLAFNHRLHAAESLDCSDCHPGATDEDEPGMPKLNQCLLCHKDIDAKKPPEKGVATLFEGGKLKTEPVSHLSSERIFSHKRHAATGTTCGTCHRGIENNERIEPAMRISMADCVQCHSDRKIAADCTTCHREIRQEWKPESHSQNWKQMHGQIVRAETGKLTDNCAMCHTESKCNSCHQSEPPPNHNNFWRLRGHAVAATLDRQNCAACHRSDSCSSCHENNLPLSHSGMWGAPHDNHCLTCHFPLSSNGCIVCHKSTPSHSEGAPKPRIPPHTPGMNCRQCHHPNGPPPNIPHADNGSNCNMCHP